MAILVTGGAGFIGSHTCVELLSAGYELVVLDSFYNSRPQALERIRELTAKDFPFCECDVRDRETLKKAFRENRIDAVVHFAGFKAVGESCRKPLEYYDNNVGGTLSLCEVMRESGCKKLVFSSSATVYGSQNTPPFREDMPTGGTTNPYGTTKYMIELILQDLCRADADWNVTLLRYFNPVGAHKSGRIGEEPNGIPNNLMPYITQVAAGRLPFLSVYGNDYPTPDGTGVRDYIHVTDLALGHVRAVEQILSGRQGVKIYNLGTGKGYSVLEMIRTFREAAGVDVPYKFAPRREGDVAVCYADASKARAELGWEAKRGLAEMCEDAWRFACGGKPLSEQ